MYLELENEDNILVKNCLNGDKKSFETLVEKYYKIIFRLANKFVRDFDDAEEITQLAFVKAYENLNEYKPKYKFFSWLYRIAINESINLEKKKKKLEKIDENLKSTEFDPAEITDNNSISDKISEALMALDIDYRLPVVLKHFLQYSYKELSYLLNIPEKTVKSRLFTGRQLLKNIFINKKII